MACIFWSKYDFVSVVKIVVLGLGRERLKFYWFEKVLIVYIGKYYIGLVNNGIIGVKVGVVIE